MCIDERVLMDVPRYVIIRHYPTCLVSRGSITAMVALAEQCYKAVQLTNGL